MLELDAVTKVFGAHTALNGVSMRIARGRTAALIGPSGCGKSTALRLMIGLLSPDRGAVRFEHRPVDDSPAVRRRFGYVIQSGGLFPHLTARANAALLARHLGRAAGWTRRSIDSRLEELRALTRFPADALDRYPAQISGGQRQRVSLMRALMLDPDVLLLDEPLGALDPIIRGDLQRDLRAIFESLGKTVVLVTHDLAEAAYLASDIVLMRDGRIVQRGALRDLAETPAEPFVTEFVTAQRERVEALAKATA